MGLVYGGKTTVRDGLALELDAANQKSWGGGGTWKDNSAQGNDGTLTNGPVHSQGPFPGAGYVTFDGSGDYLTTINSSNFQLSGDWTVEAWVYVTGGNGVLCSSLSTENVQFLRFNTSNGSIGFYARNYNTGVSYFSNTNSFSTNEWFHVACSCSSGTLRLYVNGTQVDTASNFGQTSTQLTVIGAFYYQGSHYTADPMYFNGFISNLRMVKGTALYTSNFTPQSSELTAVTNTTLLTCQGSNITDASDNSHTITSNGNVAAVYNEVSYFDLDGTDDCITFSEQTLSGDFTLELWLHKTATRTTGGNYSIIAGPALNSSYSGAGGNSHNTQFTIDQTVAGKIGLVINATFVFSSTASPVSLNTWHQLVWTRSGTTCKAYVDGVEHASGTSGNAVYIGNLGRYYITSGDSYAFIGRISSAKLYNGKALTSTEIEKNFNALRGRYGI